MGRYTTVQTYTDQDAKVAAIAYTSATGAPDAAAVDIGPLAVKCAEGEGDKNDRFNINKVDNVSGSSAGAGSGEFHMYRASRRRELDRVANMEKDYAKKKEQEEFEATRKRKIDEFESRAAKKADKRRRRKDRAKARALDAHLSGGDDEEGAEAEEEKTVSHTASTADKDATEKIVDIPSDGSFLERMLALQKQQEENASGKN